MTRPVAVLLATGCALAAFLVHEARLGTSADPVPPDAAPAAAASAPPPAKAPRPTGEWAATALARPLFSPGRRPAAPAGEAAPAPVPVPRLAGTIIGPAGRRALIVADGSKLSAMSENDTAGPWTLRAIQPGAVTISGPGGVQELRLAFGQGAGTAATASPASPAWTWNNPCGRPHRRGEPRSGMANGTSCAVALADSGQDR